LAISSDTSDFIGKKIKAGFVDYMVSFISKTGLVDFELLFKTYPFKNVTRTIDWISQLK
jgi:hypothetical protein